ncbi:MAG: hemerythrin domain-containing protein [Bryobacteraceae bacterium]|nr:hemerythrin domain-containing protein [Bryobacteraceae bacterium]
MMRHPALQPLSREHHHALALCVLVERALHEGARTPAELAGEVRDAFERDLRPHFETEEQALLPAVAQALDAPELCRRIAAEHRALEQLALAAQAGPSEETLRAFTALLRSHVRLEENELFELIQARLGADALEELGARLAAAGSRACPNRGKNG